MESDDRVFVGSPVFARRGVADASDKEPTESACPLHVQSASNTLTKSLPSLIHEVALDDKDRRTDLSTNLNPKNEGASMDMTSIPAADENEDSLDRGNVTESTIGIHTQLTVQATPQPVLEASPRHHKLRRKSSSMSIKIKALPKVNCPEKVFLCIDHSEEMFCSRFQTQSANKTSVFKTLTSAIKQFVCTKTYLNAKHQFSLIILNDDAQLITNFSSNHEELLFMLNDIAESPTHAQSTSEVEDKLFDLSDLFDIIDQQSDLPKMRQVCKVPPPYIVRVILVYGRSDSRLRFISGMKNFTSLNSSPFFFLDFVYIHEPVHERSIVEAIFSEMCALDIKGTSHIYEVDTDSNMACLYNIFAKLLAHPLQRPKQGEASINYNLETK